MCIYTENIQIINGVTNVAGQWYCSFCLEVEDDRVVENQGDKVGIDLGVKDMAVCSDGVVVPNPRISNAHQVRLRKLNKELSRRKKGGKNWWKTVFKLRLLHKKIADSRQDYIHKFTTDVCRKYGIVCLEDLNAAGMSKNRRLARHILDVSPGEIRRQFEYKAFETRYVDRFFPSSKRCHDCGFIHTELKLSDREWDCPQCGKRHDRDENASRNIRDFAVSSTGSKKSAVKKPLAKSSDGVKVSRGQKLNGKSTR